MPKNTIYVGRPGRWGNPFENVEDSEFAVEAYKRWLNGEPNWSYSPPTFKQIRKHLRGKNLACWCRLDEACHADILLELANR